MTTEFILACSVNAVGLLAAGGALYVSMKVSSSLNTFRIEFLKELDERYVRIKDFGLMETMKEKLNNSYRSITAKEIEGIEVEIRRDKSDLTIALKGILDAITESRDIARSKSK
jgi:hypothetical protein